MRVKVLIFTPFNVTGSLNVLPALLINLAPFSQVF